MSRITDMDSHIIVRGRDAVFIGRFTARGDLDRHIVWRCRSLAAHRAGYRENGQDQRQQLAHGGGRRYPRKTLLES